MKKELRKALVIGSEGNIGTPLVKYLEKQGYDIMETDIRSGYRSNYMVADINNPVDLLPAFDWQPDVVFLLSAMVSRVTCEQAGSLAITTNLGGINNVLQLCKRVNAMTVFFSTSEVYGPECDPMDEANSDPKPNNRYGLSKLLGEKLVEYEVKNYGLKAVSIRPFMMYDEEEAFGDHRSAMIRFAGNLSLGKPIEVHNGSARSWLHSSDAVRAIEAATRVKEYAAINIGNPEVIGMDELAEIVRKEVSASKKLIKHIKIPSRMTQVKRPSLERQTKLLKVVPKVSLREGVSRVCKRVPERIQAGEEWR